eukprot:gene7951-biopygen7593
MVQEFIFWDPPGRNGHARVRSASGPRPFLQILSCAPRPVGALQAAHAAEKKTPVRALAIRLCARRAVADVSSRSKGCSTAQERAAGKGGRPRSACAAGLRRYVHIQVPERDGSGRTPEAPHTTELKETGTSWQHPRLFLPGGEGAPAEKASKPVEGDSGPPMLAPSTFVKFFAVLIFPASPSRLGRLFTGTSETAAVALRGISNRGGGCIRLPHRRCQHFPHRRVQGTTLHTDKSMTRE